MNSNTISREILDFSDFDGDTLETVMAELQGVIDKKEYDTVFVDCDWGDYGISGIRLIGHRQRTDKEIQDLKDKEEKNKKQRVAELKKELEDLNK